jgi:hypothetical protein
MKFCQPHWEELKKAIDDRGLGHLVSKSGEEAVERTARAHEGTGPTKKDVDPLLAAHNNIVSNALASGGIYMMGTDEEGNRFCPVCEAAKNGHGDWIELAANGIAETIASLPDE